MTDGDDGADDGGAGGAADSGDEKGFDELVADVCVADTRESMDVRATCKRLLEWVATEGAAPDREEAVEIIADKTDYTKPTVRDWYGEVSTEADLSLIAVESIDKLIPWDPEEDVTYRFHVRADAEQDSFCIASSDLLSQRMMQAKILEGCDVKVEFDDWDEQLNTWLQETPLDVQMAEPLSEAHDVARRVLENIATAQATADREAFESDRGGTKVYVQDAEVWVRSEMVNQSLAQAGDVSKQKVRAILDRAMAGPVTKVGDAGEYTYSWRFDADELERTGIVDVDALRDAAADDDSAWEGDSDGVR